MQLKKKKRFISVSNKETAADIYPAELKADHNFNFAEQTPPCFTVCVSVCCYIKSVSIQHVMFKCEMVCHLLAIEAGLRSSKNNAEDLSALYEIKVCCSKNVSVHIQRCCAIKALQYLFCSMSGSFNAVLIKVSSKPPPNQK